MSKIFKVPESRSISSVIPRSPAVTAVSAVSATAPQHRFLYRLKHDYHSFIRTLQHCRQHLHIFHGACHTWSTWPENQLCRRHFEMIAFSPGLMFGASDLIFQAFYLLKMEKGYNFSRKWGMFDSDCNRISAFRKWRHQLMLSNFISSSSIFFFTRKKTDCKLYVVWNSKPATFWLSHQILDLELSKVIYFVLFIRQKKTISFYHSVEEKSRTRRFFVCSIFSTLDEWSQSKNDWGKKKKKDIVLKIFINV